MKKKILLFSLALLFIFSVKTYASEIMKGTTQLNFNNSLEIINFNVEQEGMILAIDIDVTYDGTENGDEFTVECYDPSNKKFYENRTTITDDEGWIAMWPLDEKTQNGNYQLVIDSSTEGVFDVSYSIRIYSGYADNLNIDAEKSMKINRLDYATIDVNSASDDKHIGIEEIDIEDGDILEFTDYYKYFSNHYEFEVYAKKTGTTYITYILNNGTTFDQQITVTKERIYLKYTSITHYTWGDKVKNTLYNALKSKVKWKSSNKKIATVNKNGTITMKNPGKCTITATYEGKKYKCKVKVDKPDPDFTAYLTSYNTRGNYFKVKIHNYGNKTLYIYSSGSKVIEDDYKSFDRKVKLKKNVVKVKPHRSKTLKFYVRGRTTWYNHKHFTLCSKFKYNNKKYRFRCWFEDSVYKRSKGWYSTYLE